jgi:hypothetical protein
MILVSKGLSCFMTGSLKPKLRRGGNKSKFILAQSKNRVMGMRYGEKGEKVLRH